MVGDITTEKIPLKFIFLTGLNNCPILLNAQQIVYIIKYDTFSTIVTNTKEVVVKETQAEIKAKIEA